jgi:hypothetical protein
VIDLDVLIAWERPPLPSQWGDSDGRLMPFLISRSVARRLRVGDEVVVRVFPDHWISDPSTFNDYNAALQKGGAAVRTVRARLVSPWGPPLRWDGQAHVTCQPSLDKGELWATVELVEGGKGKRLLEIRPWQRTVVLMGLDEQGQRTAGKLVTLELP